MSVLWTCFLCWDFGFSPPSQQQSPAGFLHFLGLGILFSLGLHWPWLFVVHQDLCYPVLITGLILISPSKENQPGFNQMFAKGFERYPIRGISTEQIVKTPETQLSFDLCRATILIGGIYIIYISETRCHILFWKQSEFLSRATLRATTSSSKVSQNPKGNSSSHHGFSEAKMLVSGRVWTVI